MTRVLVAALAAGDGPGLAARLRAQQSLRVVHGVPGQSLHAQVEEAEPDVVLLDAGRERASAWLRRTDTVPLSPMVVLAEEALSPDLLEWLQIGGRALLPRQATAPEIVSAIEAVGAGLIVLHPHTMTARRPAERVAGPGPAAAPALTPREVEVLGMMAEGLGNKIIAARLGITLYTVKFHVASIFAKLEAGNRTEAVTIGVRQGLIMI
ncbi:MAG TPA: response regulator transcription factor [Candidatus Methylomirabilis sp.]|nr:response regulator transcription factor [Candidatus Methylomirabilis sp.]